MNPNIVMCLLGGPESIAGIETAVAENADWRKHWHRHVEIGLLPPTGLVGSFWQHRNAPRIRSKSQTTEVFANLGRFKCSGIDSAGLPRLIGPHRTTHDETPGPNGPGSRRRRFWFSGGGDRRGPRGSRLGGAAR
ncbi:hypothetical protein GCM10025865_26460 [Paraoerskovia sediminicola]|uniref:Uncharacterized protein n=1 Tax=Paraoerskovia sediminicola TaxID=1138587 RepID=A0ABM8G5C4_9CELL|nr:hypothetical protein GCM10025865_26460 [Paraoerskovia sediminicola]